MNARAIPADSRAVVSSPAGDETGWTDYPIADVVDGEPAARVQVLHTVDVSSAVQTLARITCEPSTFRYRFVNDEAFVITRGRVAITVDGRRHEMRTGDVAAVPAGHDSLFEVFEPSEKFVVVTSR
ncbi:cupin domain-containing protein [Krasilnikovia sp. MM14-A1259]|uniref:cupin domain-containing protein n=1 Tax=Krasilnikovia sp. MM14-A1259 TaxID=3373539 RepID=UPI0037FAC109